jgi:CBS domain-containing protein
MDLRESLDDPVSSYMTTTFATVDADEPVSKAARAMQKTGSTEAFVSSGGKTVGILTERDILYKVVAADADPSRAKSKEVMSTPVQTIDEGSKVLDAISKMSKLGLRRLGVTRDGRIVGLVTQKAMVSGTLHQSVELPELAAPGQLRCPYCDAEMKNRDELSRHIDQVHLGLGLLEGNKTKW